MLFKEYPILYFDSHNNKKRYWKIWIDFNKNTYSLCREYGVIGGKITRPGPIEIMADMSTSKKNDNKKKIITKANALFRKKIENGFYEEGDINKKNKIIKPMGAHKLDDYHHKLKYPVCVQKKLDGYRCLGHFEKGTGKIELLSKNMKPFMHLPHIKSELDKIKELSSGLLYLDGELYEKNLKLHDIGSIVKKQILNPITMKNNIERMKRVSYYVFDCFNVNGMNLEFKERYDYLKKNIFNKYSFKYIKLVECVKVDNYDEVLKENEKYLLEGFEGVIVRNLNGLYQWNKRSYDVLRTKEFKKSEFIIIGAKEGQGTHKGSVVWRCKCSDGGRDNKEKSFWVIPVGTIEERRRVWKEFERDSSKFIGRRVRVKYLEKNTDGCVTRNPILEEFI